MRAAEVNTKPWVVNWEFFFSFPFFQTILRWKMVCSDGEQTHGLVNPRKICSLLQSLLRSKAQRVTLWKLMSESLRRKKTKLNAMALKIDEVTKKNYTFCIPLHSLKQF